MVRTPNIAAVREAVTHDLAEALGCPCYPTAPERLAPPFVYLSEPPTGFVEPADGYPFGTFAVTFALDVVQQPNPNNAAMIAAADDYATALLTLSDDYDVTLDGYATATHAGQAYLTVPATITAYITP